MGRTDFFNGALLILALAGALGAMARSSWSETAPATDFDAQALRFDDVRVEQTAEGPALRDATGALIVLKPYTRIASVSTIADALLLELAEPKRIVAYSDFSAEKNWDAHRFDGKPTLAGLSRLEPILSLEPDLVLVSAINDRSKSERLREAGLTVFDLGPMEGWTTLGRTILRVGLLLGTPERAERYVRALDRRAAAIAGDIPEEARRPALYLSVYGQQLYGGAKETSFHDVLTFAGLRDIAASKYSGWPLFSPEHVLELRPEIVVTNEGMAESVCQSPGLGRLPACAVPGGVVGLPEWLLGDPGPNMVVAAELLRERVYGKPGGP